MFDSQFMIHNSHLEEPDQFDQKDPQLRMLSKQAYVYLICEYHTKLSFTMVFSEARLPEPGRTGNFKMRTVG